ncbi:MAG TPA: tetratricopeptide repeat protein [Blastocatellia bacterium]|jgi:TolB-like protein/DNA-binding winged helix-turn-helix (wHTH) protein/Tfp pilus assembly protein PilF|nr:tetratricopeptide repeat protein [Blastocatellia bacterium]
MSLQTKHIYEFGPFHLDAAEHLLLRDGEAVPLTPKAFDLLLALVERHGHLQEKEELLKKVWPDTFVEEANLASNISLLRKAMGDGENGHRYIETAPKRGYRFVASVREIVREIDGPDRRGQPEAPNASGDQQSVLANIATTSTSKTPIESLGAWFRRHKRGAVIGVAIFVVAAATVAYFTWVSLRPKINSIAVLPFVNADPNTEYLSDGITESLINSLSQLSQLKVIARTTAFRYKGKDVDPQTVGHALKIDAVLTGRVTQQGEMLIVQVDLVNAADGAQLWGERYSRKLSNILIVQEEIVRQITERLRLRLTSGERKQITKRYTENFDAHQQYLMGRKEAEKRTGESYQKAVEHYKRALDLDPNYALAYLGLADAYYREENIRQSRAAAEKALAIDESLGEAHTSLGRILWQHDWNWPDAEREFKRAIKLDPGNAFAHRIYGYYLASMGQFDQSFAEQKQALQLDPLSPVLNLYVGHPLYFAGETDAALEQTRKTQEMDPNFVETYLTFGMVYAEKGMYAEAIAKLNKAAPSGMPRPDVISLLGYNYALWGKRDEAIKKLDELKELSNRRQVPAREMAIIYTGLGEKDQAFKWLRQACEERDGMIVFLKFHPLFKSLRADPRFADLLRCVGLPQ